MRLKYKFEMVNMDGKMVAVPTGGYGSGFDGALRLNASAAYVFELLQQDMSRQELVEALEQRYDAPSEVLRADLTKLLNALEQGGLLEQ